MDGRSCGAPPGHPHDFFYVDHHNLTDDQATKFQAAASAVKAFTGQAVTGRAIDSGNALLVELARDGTQTGQSARKLKRQIGAVLSLLGAVD